MSIFDKKRLTNETFKLDIERMRRGWYSDKYFENIGRMLEMLAAEGYTYSGKYHDLPEGMSPEDIAVGNIEVEMQWFTRRVGKTTVVGVDKALAMLRHCTGYWEGGKFIDDVQRPIPIFRCDGQSFRRDLPEGTFQDGVIDRTELKLIQSFFRLSHPSRPYAFNILEVFSAPPHINTHLYSNLLMI